MFKSKKGVSVYRVTLDKVVLGGVLHVVRYCVVVPAYAVLHVVGYYVTVTAHAILHSILGMLLQFGCCIQDAAAAVVVAPPKFPEAKSRGPVDLFLLFSFPKGELKRFFILFGLY